MNVTFTPIDFSQTPLNSYSGFYAAVIDNVFTEDECRALLDKATSSRSDSSQPWKPAGMSAETPSSVHSEFRHSDRIIYIDKVVADTIFKHLRPLVEKDIGDLSPGTIFEGITGKAGRKQGPQWKLVGINPRLSFLRYGPGHYFKRHCDGLNERTNDDSGAFQKSFVTLQIYLNGSGGQREDEALQGVSSVTANDVEVPLVGGATRFWTQDKKHFLDIFPRVGRVLVFQQRMLIHSGEEVVKGMKYTMRSDFMYESM